MKKIVAISIAVALSACAAKIEQTYPVPEIPATSVLTSELHGVSVALQPFVDARLPGYDQKSASPQKTLNTQPEGDVAAKVEDAFRNALTAQGVGMGGLQGKMITGEIRRWDSVVTAAASGTIESNATLFLEVKDSGGSAVFSGEYHGSRSSQFPVIAKQDVGESLGIAMSEAIQQAIRDPNLRRSLRQ